MAFPGTPVISLSACQQPDTRTAGLQARGRAVISLAHSICPVAPRRLNNCPINALTVFIAVPLPSKFPYCSENLFLCRNPTPKPQIQLICLSITLPQSHWSIFYGNRRPRPLAGAGRRLLLHAGCLRSG